MKSVKYEACKIIFLDIDGTLTSGFNHIPQSARNACRRARENGHLLYIATGRTREQIAPSILGIGFDGIISSAGARIETGGIVIFSAFLPPPLLDRLLAYLDGGNAPYMLETPGKIAANPRYVLSLETSAFKWTPRGIVSWLFIRRLQSSTRLLEAGFDREQVYKLVFRESECLRFEDVEREFRAECELFRFSIPVSVKGGGEITSSGVNKGTALERVARFHGIRRENTIAFGDSDNDRPLLACAGLGIAMGNGDEALKQAADDVTGHVSRGGLAAAFRKYALA
ncbi:MAG: HAD family hydrolase [Treponema sp.]|jgi:Cof subfamily protein (haloacid dehalogenase superfamily)|nr:HAD family hydrolase [Treponema sp.]